MSMHAPAVVVGVDGSGPAAAAARAAAEEARRREWPLRLVRAFHWPAGDLPGLPDGIAFDRAGNSIENAAAQLFWHHCVLQR